MRSRLLAHAFVIAALLLIVLVSRVDARIDPAGGSRWDESPAGGRASGAVIPPAGLPDTAVAP